MMKPLVLLALLTCPCAVPAQVPPRSSEVELQKCLMVTPQSTWMKLHLNDDQMRRIVLVQQACRTECEKAGAQGTHDAISHEDGSRILSEVENVLTADVYKAWVAQCGEPPSAAPARK